MFGRTLRPTAVVSCHVERPLDDECWRRFSRLQERRPDGFAIAALLRPPDAEAGEDAELWLERARAAAERGPLGHHTHFVGPAHARPPAGGAGQHAERVRREALWMREQGLEPRLFCGGGWYIDEGVAAVAGRARLRRLHGHGVRSVLPRRRRAPSLRREPDVALAPRRAAAARAAVHALPRHGGARGGRLAPELRPRVLPRHGSADAKAPGGARVGTRRARPALRGDRPRDAARGLELASPSGPSA